MGKHQRVIADAVAKELELPLRVGRKFLQRVIDMVADDIVFTGRIELRGLGTFKVNTRAARRTTHPTTGKTVLIPEKKAVVYRSSAAIRRRLNPPRRRRR